jgi:hypothetical protein
MTKKSKKVKTPRVKGGSKASGGNKDAITGLDLGNGLILKSDTVYTDQSPEYKALVGNTNSTYSTGGGTLLEIEVGSNGFIYTFQTKGEISRDGMTQTTPDYWLRGAAIGNISFNNKGLLAGGRITEFSDWTYAVAPTGDTTERIGTFRNPIEFTGSLSNAFWSASSGKPIFDFDSWKFSQGEASDPKSDFWQYSTSRYFPEGWWNNPFAPNLI